MTTQFYLWLTLLALWPAGRAFPLPSTYEIPGLAVDSIRLGYPLLFKYDFNSKKDYSPYLVESINAILGFYKNDFRLTRREASGAEISVPEYLNELRQRKITIYKMDKLQGKVLRAMVSMNIPVLLIGRVRNNEYQVSRYHGDVIYAYHPPFQPQSSKTEDRDRVFYLKTARGFDFASTEFTAPNNREATVAEKVLRNENITDLELRVNRLEWSIQDLKNNPAKLVMQPFVMFDFFCVITTPDLPLDEVKKRVNQGLGSTSFDYKLPEFEELKDQSVGQ